MRLKRFSIILFMLSFQIATAQYPSISENKANQLESLANELLDKVESLDLHDPKMKTDWQKIIEKSEEEIAKVISVWPQIKSDHEERIERAERESKSKLNRRIPLKGDYLDCKRVDLAKYRLRKDFPPKPIPGTDFESALLLCAGVPLVPMWYLIEELISARSDPGHFAEAVKSLREIRDSENSPPPPTSHDYTHIESLIQSVSSGLGQGEATMRLYLECAELAEKHPKLVFSSLTEEDIDFSKVERDIMRGSIMCD